MALKINFALFRNPRSPGKALAHRRAALVTDAVVQFGTSLLSLKTTLPTGRAPVSTNAFQLKAPASITRGACANAPVQNGQAAA